MAAFDWASAVAKGAPEATDAAQNAGPSGAYDWAQAALGASAKPTPANIRAQIKSDAHINPALMGQPSPLQRSLIGVGHGMMNVVHGGEQLALNVLDPLPTIAAHSMGAVKLTPKGKTGAIQRALASVNQAAQAGNAAFAPLEKAYPWTAGAGNIAGNLAATAPLMALGGAGVDAALPDLGPSLLGTMARGAAKDAVSGGIGGALQYVAPSNGQSRLRNTLEGAGLNALIPIGLRPVGMAAHAGIGALYKGMGALRPQLDPAVQQAARSFGIRPTVGELSGSVPHQKLETALEHLPLVGMGKVRAGQALAFKNAAEGLLKPYAVDSDEPQQMIRDAAQNMLNANRATAKGLYDKVSALAAHRRTGVAAPLLAGQPPYLMDMAGTQNAAKSLADKFSGNEDLDAQPEFVSKLQKYAQAQPRSFEDARKLRSQLGQMQASAGFGTPEALAYGNLRSAVENDMQKYALSHGAKLADAYNAAQKYYRENVAPFKSIAPLKSLVSGKMDTDTVLGSFVKNDRPQLASKLMDHLSPDAQNAVRWSVLNKGFEKANLGGAREGASFDPRRFATYWENLGKTRDALFTPEAKTLIDGYAKLARAIPRAADYSEFMHKPTGVKTAVMGTGIAEGAALATHPHVAIPSLLGAVGLRKMLTEPWGQRILLRAASANRENALKPLAQLAGSYLRHSLGVAQHYVGPTLAAQMHQQNTAQPASQ